MRKRIEWLDIAKGIGILLVVLSHCLNINEKPAQILFTFHMPMFFLLSGYVFSGEDRFPVLVKKKAESLLLPYYGYILLGLVVSLLLPQWRSGLSVSGIQKDLWIGNPEVMHNSSIWFLVCLFYVTLLFHGIQKLPIYLQIPAVIVCGFLSCWYAESRFTVLGYDRLPQNLDVALMAVVFFAAGYYIKSCRIMDWITGHWWTELAVALLSAVCLFWVYSQNGYVNIRSILFGNPILYVMGGLSGSFAVIGISALITRLSTGFPAYVKQVFQWFGRHSLTFLGLQSLLIRLYVLFMDEYFGVNLAMYQFPAEHTWMPFVLVSFVVCPLMIFVHWMLKKWIASSEKELIK